MATPMTKRHGKLTDAAIKTAKTTEKPYKLADGEEL